MKKSNTRSLLKKIFGQSKEKIKLEIINNECYMQWLIMFTEKYPAWRDDMINYEALNITNEDKKRMEKLRCFFEIINNYAKENEINAYTYDNEVYYVVKINDCYFRVGKIKGPDFCYYCQKEFVKDIRYIDFGHIKLHDEKGINNTGDYKDDLEYLENVMIDLYNKKIPVLEIKKKMNKVIRRIRAK